MGIWSRTSNLTLSRSRSLKNYMRECSAADHASQWGISGAFHLSEEKKMVGQNDSFTGYSVMLRYKIEQLKCRNVHKGNSSALVR